MPNDIVLKSMNTVHAVMMKLTGGRFGWEFGKMPVVRLTTTGRKSGEARTVMLTSPLQRGETIVVVASKGGDDHHPAWFLNLSQNPHVQVELKGKATQPMTARVATPDERVELWPLVTAKYRGYAGYQTKTEREIPLVLLTPGAAG